MIIEKEELQSLIPHRGRMLLLDRIIDYNLEERLLTAEYDVTEECLFYDPALRAVPSWVGFEFMAQAISALSGLGYRQRGEKPMLGFIMSVFSMRIVHPSFNTGSPVRVKVKEAGCVDVVYTFDGEAFFEGKKIMEGKLTVLDANEEQMETIRNGKK
jgi:predicted hotdog family 3-hydroxylacyl-ACP dehydratase